MRHQVSRATFVVDCCTLAAIVWLAVVDIRYSTETRNLAETFLELVHVTRAQTEQLNRLCIELKCDVEPEPDDEAQP